MYLAVQVVDNMTEPQNGEIDGLAPRQLIRPAHNYELKTCCGYGVEIELLPDH